MGEVFQVDHIIFLSSEIILNVQSVGAPDSFELGIDTLANILRVVHVQIGDEIAEHSKCVEFCHFTHFPRF